MGGIVEELDRYRGRFALQPQAMLVVTELGESADRHHRHILAVGVAAAGGAGVEQKVGAAADAGVLPVSGRNLKTTSGSPGSATVISWPGRRRRRGSVLRRFS